MTEKEIHDKIGAMHLRFLDQEDEYVKLLNLLADYNDISDDNGQTVISALRDGLKDYERYQKLDMALSPRSIIIEKKGDPSAKKVKKGDAEGYYRVVLILDDGSRHVVHFGRKQTHLLYILFLLCSKKNGLLADFFSFEDRQVTPVLETVAQLVKMIYPQTTDTAALQMAKDLSPDHSFSDTLQKMKAPLVNCLRKANLYSELYWYMPEAVKQKKKQLYQIHMPQVNIICPPDFQPVIDALPDAADILLQDGIDIKAHRDMENDFANFKQAAEEGDADGLYYMGVYFGTGDVVSHDYKKSITYFKQAAQKGHLDAIFQLGVYYMFGFGVEKDIRQALKYFELAAGNDHCEAAAWAGQIYERGIDGVKVDHKKAFHLYMIAAKQDHEEAMWYVIQGYLLGQGTKQNFSEAWDWEQKAEKLGYVNIPFLYGVYLYNFGEEYYEDALDYFNDAVKNQIPMAYFMMSKLAIRGIGTTGDIVEEAKEWLHKGAKLGNESCISALQRAYPETYNQFKDKYKKPLSLLTIYRECFSKMDHLYKEAYIQMVDAYRERWHRKYLVEICRQLSIHKPSNHDDGSNTPKRRITVRKTKNGNLPYELVLTLANGEEIVINRINPHALVLFLLTIICSYKSGYVTMMAKSEACRPMLKELVRLVCGNEVINLDKYVEAYMSFEKDEAMKKNEDYYKQYSNKAKIAVKKAVGTSDDPFCFLFDICRIAGRKAVRRMNIDVKDIVLPPELYELTQLMPDAMDVLKLSESQTVTE